MTDLHERLTAAVRLRRQQAEAATEDWTHVGVATAGKPPFVAPDNVTAFIAANSPDVVLRRCERDEKVLAKHWPTTYSLGGDQAMEVCAGCGMEQWPAECDETQWIMAEFGITEGAEE